MRSIMLLPLAARCLETIEEEMNFIETHDSYKKLRQKYCLYNYEIVYTL